MLGTLATFYDVRKSYLDNSFLSIIHIYRYRLLSVLLRLSCCLKLQRISELPNCKHVPRVGLEPAALGLREKRLDLQRGALFLANPGIIEPLHSSPKSSSGGFYGGRSMTCWLAESSVTLNILLPNQRRDIHITSGSPMLQLRCCLKSQRISGTA